MNSVQSWAHVKVVQTYSGIGLNWFIYLLYMQVMLIPYLYKGHPQEIFHLSISSSRQQPWTKNKFPNDQTFYETFFLRVILQ